LRGSLSNVTVVVTEQRSQGLAIGRIAEFSDEFACQLAMPRNISGYQQLKAPAPRGWSCNRGQRPGCGIPNVTIGVARQNLHQQLNVRLGPEVP
jgi:hypothetical protein